MTDSTEEDLIVRLRPLPSPIPGMVRLRKLLKNAGRFFGLRCVHVSSVPKETPLPRRTDGEV